MAFIDFSGRAGDLVDKILLGRDLPVEPPTRFDLVVNLIVAKAIGLDVPLAWPLAGA